MSFRKNLLLSAAVTLSIAACDAGNSLRNESVNNQHQNQVIPEPEPIPLADPIPVPTPTPQFPTIIPPTNPPTTGTDTADEQPPPAIVTETNKPLTKTEKVTIQVSAAKAALDERTSQESLKSLFEAAFSAEEANKLIQKAVPLNVELKPLGVGNAMKKPVYYPFMKQAIADAKWFNTPNEKVPNSILGKMANQKALETAYEKAKTAEEEFVQEVNAAAATFKNMPIYSSDWDKGSSGTLIYDDGWKVDLDSHYLADPNLDNIVNTMTERGNKTIAANILKGKLASEKLSSAKELTRKNRLETEKTMDAHIAYLLSKKTSEERKKLQTNIEGEIYLDELLENEIREKIEEAERILLEKAQQD